MKLPIAVLLVGLSSFPALAGVTYVGSNVDLGSGWRTSSVAKNDIDGNNVLGTDGWFVAGDTNLYSNPTYLTSLAAGPFGSLTGFGAPPYADIDNPSTTPGATPSLMRSGTVFNYGGPTNLLSFTFGSLVPGRVRLGLMVDNLDFVLGPTLFQVTTASTPAGAGWTSLTAGNTVTDWYFFDIDASPGEVYNVFADGGCSCLGAASFDTGTAVPEPSTAVLFSSSVLALGWLARRRSLRSRS